MASQIDPTTIDITYPIAGQDNDTRGFHDNYRAIQNALVFARAEITDLQSNIVVLTANDAANYGNANVSSYLPSYTGNISAGNVSVNGNITSTRLTLSSVIQFANLTTAQINAVSSPARGMTAYNYTTGNIQVYNGTKWANVTLS
jgi:hypothetical protein